MIESEMPLDHEKIRQVINNTGYLMLSASEEEMTKRSLIRSILGK